MQRITPCLWFDGQAEEAAAFYCGIFPHSAIAAVTHYDAHSAQASGRLEGSVMTVSFELDGQSVLALNGGPQFPFTEAISLMVSCETQSAVDHYWGRLSEGGEEGVCGWLKDRYGVSWQIVPAEMGEMMASGTPEQVDRLTQTFLPMKKLDLAELRRAYRGGAP